MTDAFFFFFSSRRRHTRLQGDWSSDVCSSDLDGQRALALQRLENALAGPGGLAGHETHSTAVPHPISSVREQFSILRPVRAPRCSPSEAGRRSAPLHRTPAASPRSPRAKREQRSCETRPPLTPPKTRNGRAAFGARQFCRGWAFLRAAEGLCCPVRRWSTSRTAPGTPAREVSTAISACA